MEVWQQHDRNTTIIMFGNSMTETQQLLLDKINKAVFHLERMNSEVGELAQRMAVLETKVESILWVERTIAATAIAIIVGACLYQVIKKRNNKA
jgi:hypothetical protein